MTSPPMAMTSVRLEDLLGLQRSRSASRDHTFWQTAFIQGICFVLVNWIRMLLRHFVGVAIGLSVIAAFCSLMFAYIR